ncbi:AAA family ATPase, partial [Candidatus Peregrinibacteria bacterium]|nr:AAA family ATPase [Candidatus Peregrinibacteria bacterium]
MKFSKQAKQVIDLITKTNDTIFVTGKAGTGKSVLLDHIKSIAKKKIIILAPTGISAINVNGETIHSFFTLKPGFELDEAKSMYMDEKKRSKYKNIQAIAIDEISMVRADLLDAIDTVLKRARKSKDPFGGVQMIFFGDLYQLPPVLTQADRDKFFSNYDSPYFFDANVFKSLSQKNLFSNSELSVFELDKIYRQKDRGFIDILNAVRDGALEDKHLLSLNSRFFPSFEPEEKDNYIHLVTTNAMAATINDSRMKKLNKKEFSFTAVHS